MQNCAHVTMHPETPRLILQVTKCGLISIQVYTGAYKHSVNKDLAIHTENWITYKTRNNTTIQPMQK